MTRSGTSSLGSTLPACHMNWRFLSPQRSQSKLVSTPGADSRANLAFCNCVVLRSALCLQEACFQNRWGAHHWKLMGITVARSLLGTAQQVSVELTLCLVPLCLCCAVTRFARATGDVAALSSVDIKLLALVHTLEVAAHGSDHLSTAPNQVGCHADSCTLCYHSTSRSCSWGLQGFTLGSAEPELGAFDGCCDSMLVSARSSCWCAPRFMAASFICH